MSNSIRYFLVLLVSIIFTASKVQSQTLIISEFLAINDSVLADEDSDFSDWIEIFNPTASAVSINGWYLTDDSAELNKWKFPDLSINAGEYLIVYASSKDKALVSGNLHTNFKLSGSGEYLALVKPDGITITSSFDPSFPTQLANISYGIYNEQYVFLSTPTPGTVNSTDNNSAPLFNYQRGLYNEEFDLVLSSVDVNFKIYYTLDGSSPTLSNGIEYTAPIAINKTTVLSALAINNSTSAMSEVITHTYLFSENIMQQSNTPSGYPLFWGEGYPADYEMDPEICTTEKTSDIDESLKSLPTLSLVTDIDHLFYDSDTAEIGGLYMNTTKHTEEWERPVSMEYFDSAQNKSFQINCGLRIHGGNGRKPGNTPKHSFRVSFRSEYGPTKLNFNLFDEKSAENEFNSLVLRSGYNYSWGKNSPVQCEGTDYIRDPFAKLTQLDMDRTAAHSKFVHLYLNGLYWGVYNISEKITNDFVESYLGGKEEDYDVVKDHLGVTDGDRVAWDSLLILTSQGFETIEKYQKVQGNNPDGTKNPSYLNLLDVRNLVDYMILNFYIGNGDWDRNNWLAARNRITNEHGFKFFSWDGETSLNDVNEDIVDINNPGNPSGIYTKLRENKEFRLFFADRVHKHFFNGGVLTSEKTEERYMKLANTIDKSIIAESARWGDYRRDVDPGTATYELYTYEDHWLKRVEFMQDAYLPNRSDIVFQQLKDANLYPALDAPVFSSYGGDFADSIRLSITAGSNDIYYTIDDSDPREIGGAVSTTGTIQYGSPILIDKNVIIKARAKDGDNWSALTRAKFNFNANVEDIPTLIYPENSISVNSENNLTFIWNKFDVVGLTSYELNIYNIDKAFSYTISKNDTTFEVPANKFNQNESYCWDITAKDGLNEFKSIQYCFSTKNIVPGAFSIVNPINFEEHNIIEDIKISWTKSVDDDEINYILSIEGKNTKLDFNTKDTVYIVPQNTLTAGETYKIIVSATDGIDITKQEVIINVVGDETDIDISSPIANIKIYPNPSTGIFKISGIRALDQIVIEVHNLMGNVVQHKNINVNNNILDISEQPDGVYFVSINSGTNIVVMRIIKQ